MKRLILLRHAKAVPKAAATDAERALASDGRAQMTSVARYFADEKLVPDAAIVSPSVRTRETWSLSGLDAAPARFDERIYEASTEDLFDVVRDLEPTAGTVVLVGHNPGIEEFGRALVRNGEPKLRDGFPTAAVAVIAFDVERWDAIAPRSGHLVAFETPASLGIPG